MAVRPSAAARFVCERGAWQVSNIALQKILYIAHMIHMGRTAGERLINAPFEAWDYGPVVPELYHRVKIFGDRPIQNIFFSASDVLEGSPEGKTLDEACKFLLQKKPGELVAITHHEDGAWAKNYLPGARGVVISDKDILNEYRIRIQSEPPAIQ